MKDKFETARNRVAVDKNTLATSVPGVAGGDVVTGTTWVVDAIDAGHRAARAIEAFLKEEATKAWPPVVPVIERLPEASIEPEEKERLLEIYSPGSRFEPPKRDAAERKHDFNEVEAALSEEDVVEAAKRCLECGICSECNQCGSSLSRGRHPSRRPRRDRGTQGRRRHAHSGIQDRGWRCPARIGIRAYANVVTSIEFERMLSATGPFAGIVQRTSDGKHPKKIAFIQCVGSRDTTCGNDYCSSVCCMYATKEAIIAREHDASIQPTIFYMDIRAFGKNFRALLRARQDESGVRYVSAPFQGYPKFQHQEPAVHYTMKPERLSKDEFDMVVLSVGLSRRWQRWNWPSGWASR